MATPTTQEFEQLKQQVEQLTALAKAQAEYQQLLQAFATSSDSTPSEKKYSRAEAMAYLGVKRTRFDKAREELKITPAAVYSGRFPRFTHSQVEQIGEHLEQT